MDTPESLITVTLGQRLLFGFLALALLGFLLRLIQRRQIDLRYGLMWTPIALFVLFCSVFPVALGALAHFLGFKLASNAVMSLAIVGLLFVTLLQTVAGARTKKDLRDLAQRMALLETRFPPPSDSVKNR